LLRAFIYQYSLHYININCIYVINSINSLIYNKILKLSNSAKKYVNVGSIMNNINIDVISFYYFVMMSVYIFSTPIMIIISVVMLIL
jgi:hypothetical protein